MGFLGYLDLAVGFTTPGSGDGIMLNSLSQFQALGWEIPY